MVKLVTNEGEFYVRASCEELRRAMFEYTRAKMEKGVPLAGILFCWHPISLTPLANVRGKA